MHLTNGLIINKDSKVVYIFRHYVSGLYALGDLLAQW